MNGRHYVDHEILDDVLGDVAAERHRQDSLRDMGKFSWTLADDHVLIRPWDGVVPLGEEFGEVCRALMGEGNLREELVQLAACCVAWIEALDRQASLQSESVPTWRPELTAADYRHIVLGVD